MVLPYLQANELVSQNLMDTSRRYETGSETMDSLLLTAISIYVGSSIPNIYRSIGAQYRKGTLSLGNTNLLKWIVRKLALLLQYEVVSLSPKAISKPALCYLYIPKLFTIKHL